MKAPAGATHLNTINGKYFKVEDEIILKTYGVEDPSINNGADISDSKWIVEIPKDKSHSEKIQEVKDSQLLSINDEYMPGLYNGIELAQSIVDNREPKFLSSKDIK